MATISGRVVFDRDRSATINAGDSGIANVPVVLQNTATDVRLVVLTDTNGNYSFINVPMVIIELYNPLEHLGAFQHQEISITQ